MALTVVQAGRKGDLAVKLSSPATERRIHVVTDDLPLSM